ncbi:MAG: HAD family hydrolase [Cytophagales bacterium]|nr:HAD family hydrolase [Cytophagales bacterium]
MKISFDLDDTLIPSEGANFPTMKRNLWLLLLKVEPIRGGSVRLIKQLKSEGHEVGIYTTSYRSRFQIWLQFLMYGLSISFIINENLNRQTLSNLQNSASKYPPAFEIDLHVDDSPGVGIEGERFGFNTIIVDKQDLEWVSTVLFQIRSFQLSDQ